MNSRTTTMNLALREQPVNEYLYGIIDSKMQYVDYQLNSVINEINMKQNSEMLNIEETGADFHPCQVQNQKIFDKIVQFSKTKRLLLLLRSMLDVHNTDVVLELVTDNLFMYYSEKLLIKKLQNNLTNNTTRH